MKYVRVGNSGLRTSQITLGCMSFGTSKWEPWVLEEREALEVMKAAYDAGIIGWDTAGFYSNGISEKLIAKACKQFNIPREKLVIMSKCYFGVNENTEDPWEMVISRRSTDPNYANTTGLSRTAIFHQVDASLKRLETDYLDLLWIHRCDRETPKEETMKALHDLVESGKVRYIGASNMWTWELATYQAVAEKHNWTKFVAMQGIYSALYREEEREMNSFCKETGVGLIPWFALNSGRLARPLSKQHESTRCDFSNAWLEPFSETDKTIVNRVEEIAIKRKLSMAQIAFLWVASRVDAPLLGINKKDRVGEFVAALEESLTDEEIDYISEPYKPHPVFFKDW